MTPRRGEVYEVRLGPVEGTEQGGVRPVIVVSRDALNAAVHRVITVPCTTQRGRPVHPTWVLLHPPEGGLTAPSLVLCEQVRSISEQRLLRHRGVLSADAMAQIDRALAIAIDLVPH